MTILARSVQTRRFQSAVLAVLLVIVVFILLNYYEMLSAAMEASVVRSTLANLNDTIVLYEATRSPTDSTCSLLNNKDFFSPLVGAAPMIANSDYFSGLNTKRWQYDAAKHQLIYHVSATHYFQSPLGPYVVISLLCKDGHIAPEVSPHRWCQHWSLWGC